ncbi:hypothetical protein JXA56_05275 [Candidatus Micrarchaeota archaeon]|nr:hypothetical protein [Candidatus Micrarchaeota archaeon]
MMICEAGFESFFSGTILPLVAFASVGTSVIIALAFMFGRATSNPKVTVWAKTEILQLVISVASIFILIMTINAFCVLNMAEIAGIFSQEIPDAPSCASGGSVSVYCAAETYLKDAAQYSHNAMSVVRYHLQGYTILSFLNAFRCDFNTGGIGWGCLFGYSGANQQPFGGYGATIAALNIFFNSTIIAFFTAMNFLFILLFVQKGFVFIFLPLGVFLRAMPYMRGFGSLLIAVAMSFLTVYPLMLGVLWIMSDILIDGNNNLTPIVSGPGLSQFYNEWIYPNEESKAMAQSFGSALSGPDYVENTYFPQGENAAGAIIFAANAFVAAVFLPTVALLTTIASIAYLSRLYGEAIDLSKITQLV